MKDLHPKYQTTEVNQDDEETLLENVSLDREWIVKVNMEIDTIEILGHRFGTVEGSLNVLEGTFLKRFKSVLNKLKGHK